MSAPLRFSALRQIGKSPAHYAAHIAQEQETTSGMDIGSAADLLILGGRRVLAYPGPVRRGKEFDAFAAANADALIVTQKEGALALGIAEAVAACPDAVRVLTGARQSTQYWTLQGRACRGTPDVRGDGFITDLKTSETADPKFFPWKLRRFAYHAAAAWYLDGLTLCGFDVRKAYVVVVEQAPPHVVTVFQLTEHVLDMGERLYRLWLEQLLVCEASGAFPPYSQSIVELDLVDDGDIDLADAVELVETTQ